MPPAACFCPLQEKAEHRVTLCMLNRIILNYSTLREMHKSIGPPYDSHWVTRPVDAGFRSVCVAQMEELRRKRRISHSLWIVSLRLMSAPSLNTSEEEHTNMMHQDFGKREMTEFVLKVSHIVETDLQVKSDISLVHSAINNPGLVWLCSFFKMACLVKNWRDKLFNFTQCLQINPEPRRIKQDWTKKKIFLSAWAHKVHWHT